MRIVFTTALLVLSLSACDRQSSDHLDKASHEAAAAVSDVGKSIDDSARAVKEAG